MDEWSFFDLICHQELNFPRIFIKAFFAEEEFYPVLPSGLTTVSELTENLYWPIIENNQFLQLLIFFRNKSSAASNSTFISFGSSVLFFSNNWLAACRVFLMLNRSDSLAFVVRWTSTSGIKIWITCWSVFQLHTLSWTLFTSKILAWICCL